MNLGLINYKASRQEGPAVVPWRLLQERQEQIKQLLENHQIQGKNRRIAVDSLNEKAMNI